MKKFAKVLDNLCLVDGETLTMVGLGDPYLEDL